MSSGLEFHSELSEDGTVLLVLGGRLDVETYPVLEREFLSWLDRGHASFLIQLDRVDRISTVGGAAFIALLRLAQDQGGHIQIVEPPQGIPAVFEELEVSQLMPWVKLD